MFIFNCKLHMPFLIVALLSGLAVATCVGEAKGHEGHGFTHMNGSSGPLIGMKQCPGSMTQLWFHDDDGDGKVDKCTQVFFDHDKIHVKPAVLKDGTCLCWEDE